jgi:hypothetical protein
MTEKTCRICFKKFTPPSGPGQSHACFCGDVCREKGTRQTQRASYERKKSQTSVEDQKKEEALSRDRIDARRKINGGDTCSGCKKVKPASEFSHGAGKCKSCASTSWKKYYSSHKEKLGKRKRKKSFRKRTPEQKEAYIKEKKYVKELHSLQKQGRRRCRLCDLIKPLDDFPNDSRGRVYYNKKSYCNHCALEEYRRPYWRTQAGKDSKRKADFKYKTKRLKEDPLYKFSCNVRALVRNSLTRKGFSKGGKRTTDILGCSVPEAREHIKKQFKERMTWENHGEWEIDHIVPVALAKTEEEAIALNHHSNFQPLWKKENGAAGKFTKLILSMVSPENKIRYKEIIERAQK